MKLFIVTEDYGYEGYDILGIFNTKEEAIISICEVGYTIEKPNEIYPRPNGDIRVWDCVTQKWNPEEACDYWSKK